MDSFLDQFGNTIDTKGLPQITSGRDSIITSILSIGTFVGSLLACQSRLLGRALMG